MEIPVLNDVIQDFKGNLKVPEIRVWCHPHYVGEHGDDYYEVFDTFQKALDFIAHNKKAEDAPLIAFKGYEINLWEIKEREDSKKKLKRR